MARVLVVEDEESIARLIEVGLQLAGHQVTVTGNAKDGLDAVQKVKPHVIVLDWMLPGKTGIEVLEVLRRKGWRKDVRVVMLTAKAQERDIMRGYQVGVDSYLIKPFDMDVLNGVIEEVLTLSPDQLAARREEELRKAGLLRALDDMLGEE